MRAHTEGKGEMGKRFAIVIGVAVAGVMALGAAGCGGDDDDETTTAALSRVRTIQAGASALPGRISGHM